MTPHPPRTPLSSPRRYFAGPFCTVAIAIHVIISLISGSVASANSLIVPDNVPTIQDALDTAVDTVYVRSGTYAESLYITNAVHLQGLGATRPQIAGATFRPVYNLDYTLQAVELTGPAYIANDDLACNITFLDCLLDAGIQDLSLYLETQSITLRRCTLLGTSSLRATGFAVIDSSRIEGEIMVGDGDLYLSLTHNVFLGNGANWAVRSISYIFHATIENNQFANYIGAVVLPNVDDESVVNGNTILACQLYGIYVGPARSIVVNNIVRACSHGIIVSSYESVAVRDNIVANCSAGISIYADGTGIIERNIVSFCGGDGIEVSAYQPFDVHVVRNTSVGNNGSGFVANSASDGGGAFAIINNIASGNGQYGIRFVTPITSETGCNDWFDNALGPVIGREPASSDLAVDPLFCDAPGGDFHLNKTSKLNGSACGQVGALDVGCGTTATLVTRFEGVWTQAGIRVTWEAGEAPSLRLQRSETNVNGLWIRPLTTRSIQQSTIVEVDGTAAPDRPYWYRLVAGDAEDAPVVGSPLLVTSRVSPTFALGAPTPNPSPSLIRIPFSLATTSVIDIDVIDLQGRCIAILSHGIWNAGHHILQWSGHAQQGMAAKAGMYFVRYRYPGGYAVRQVLKIP